jgi:hypothetical protein
VGPFLFWACSLLSESLLVLPFHGDVPDIHKHFATSDQNLESLSVSVGFAFPDVSTLLYNSQAFTIDMSNK